MIRGEITVAHETLKAGDGWATGQGGSWEFVAGNQPVEALLFDLA